MGLKRKPVDVQFIGPGCSLPILKHRLQRLFNRKIMKSIVSYDVHHEALLNERSKAQRFRRFWEKGFLSIYSDVPSLLRHRRLLGRGQRKRLEKRCKRFSLRMSGMSLATLGNISYSYFQDMRLGPYAYAFSFANRLIGYIKG